jgi:hypothetical protein
VTEIDKSYEDMSMEVVRRASSLSRYPYGTENAGRIYGRRPKHEITINDLEHEEDLKY